MNRVSPLLSLFSLSQLLKQTLTALMVRSYSSFLSKNLQNPGRYKANKLPLLLLLSWSHPVRAHSISDARAKEWERERLAGLGCKLSVGLGFLCPIHTAIMTHCGCFSIGFRREAWDTKCTGAVETGFTVSRIFRASFQSFLLYYCAPFTLHCDTLAVAFTLGHPLTWNPGPRRVRAVETGSLFRGYLASFFFHSN
jgi:hypothetical protein